MSAMAHSLFDALIFHIAYISPEFNKQYTGATNVGLIRGAYHFARPGSSSGAAQANYFLAHGGGWSGDGRTLPGAIDLEGKDHLSSAPWVRELTPAIEGPCYGLSPGAMVNWIRDFSNTYHAKTGRYPVIYTTTSWWSGCTADYSGFGNLNPLWLARWADSPGALPAGWPYHTFWQYADKGPNPGDQDSFNGDDSGLKR